MSVQQLIPSICPIFLSCVTKEFRPYRDMLAKDLSLPHVKVQVQEDFIEGGGTLLEKLDDYIANCVAVIHLVGSGTGTKPKLIEVSGWLKKHSDFIERLPFLKDCLDTLSYTQWEVWLAIYHEVSCYVYKAEPSAIPATGFVEDLVERKLQEEHWQRLCEHGKDRSTFPNEQDLRILVLRSLSKILPHGEIKSKVIPKGLRSFDAGDTAFFLDLLPGLHDENNLPESIRFWKFRIERRDTSTFTVGVIYGPSGCGKSSLIKAGLIPRLAPHVKCVYVEATAAGTEAKLLKGLRRCSKVADDLGLIQSLKSLIEEGGHPEGSKLLLVIDQFEQWLHGRQFDQATELVQALRQCDGKHVQAVLMVRDDFWSDLSRFMNELDVPMLQGQNSVFVDLFDTIHSENVLTAFGRGYGRLGDDITAPQSVFVKMAVEELAQKGTVISVRLALFAEMVKGKPWVPQTLKDIGGTEGVGFTFLEETFSTAKANPQYRRHQKAAQAVLKSLLPESGTDIKGHMRSRQELFEASGYSAQAHDFDDLLYVLDNDLRLITPTSQENQDDKAVADNQAVVEKRFYQLTHDYLVPSLRDWLTRKKKETRQGRAELLLEDFGSVWNARPENRQLPPLWHWLSIQWFVPKKFWTPPQRKMMDRACRVHSMRGAASVLLLVSVTVTGLAIRKYVNDRERTIRNEAVEQENATRADGLVRAVINADTAQVPGLISRMAEYRKWTDPLLRCENDKATANSPQKLHASLALLPVDATQVDYLIGRLLDANASDVPVIRASLERYKDDLLSKLWSVAEAPSKGNETQRLRAAAALVQYDPENPRWDTISHILAEDLVSVNPVFLGIWSNEFRSIKHRLVEPLGVVFRQQHPERATEQILATNLLADYAAGNVQVLSELLLDADEKQFPIIFIKLKTCGDAAFSPLRAELNRPFDPKDKMDVKEVLARRKANAAAALFKLGQPSEIWDHLKHCPDPSVRSHLINRFGRVQSDPLALVDRLNVESELSIRRALVLSLGAFNAEDWPAGSREKLVSKLQDEYVSTPDAGLRAAMEWLLRQWEHNAWILEKSRAGAADAAGRVHRVQAFQEKLASLAEPAPRAVSDWYINAQGQTMVVLAWPSDLIMGSPLTEDGRFSDEVQHKVRINRSFAIADKQITVELFRLFNPSYKFTERFAPSIDCPVASTSWYDAARYCNWLSEQEGVPPNQFCYAIGLAEEDVTLKAGYLHLTGYRLPTEAEMEYATRANSQTSRYFGGSDSLLVHYGWFLKNSNDHTWPVGLKKPNDFGLFDMHGNVWCWCQERYRDYEPTPDGRPVQDEEDILKVDSLQERALRGGPFFRHAFYLRSANRYGLPPKSRYNYIGFRVARTIVAHDVDPVSTRNH